MIDKRCELMPKRKPETVLKAAIDARGHASPPGRPLHP